MHYPHDELARRMEHDRTRQALTNRRLFKLLYILFFAFGMPTLIIGSAALEGLVKDRMSTFIRPRICKTLGKLKGDESLELLILVLGMGGSDREHAVEAIRHFGSETEDGLLAHADPAERAGICAALKAVGTAKCLPYLKAAAQDEKPQTAELAKQALTAVKQRAEKQ